eukprot:11136-Heterococcus_DN1.PRE.1
MKRVLSNAEILQNILSYAGPGCWLFISPVCKVWKQLYEQVDAAALLEDYPDASIRMTAYECVFQSVSCLQLACEYGLQARFASELLQQRAGAWFNVPTLLAAQELGFQ